MGNCLFGGMGATATTGDDEEVIKVVTSNGGIMELYPPVTPHSITTQFPVGHAIFPSHDLFWKPLPPHQHLLPGHSYFLLPLHYSPPGHVRSNSIPNTALLAPYRMSFDNRGMLLKRSHTDVFSRFHNNSSISYVNYNNSKNISRAGVWKVKLVISPEQLLEILSQEARTQELIESVTTVAKCGNGASSATPGFSDDWSLSSGDIFDANVLPPKDI